MLGIDTATLVCSVAVVSADKTLAEYTLQVKKTHSERLLPLIAAMLKDAGFTPQDLNGVAVAAGPGSFTGVRIGMATAKALGQALDIPLCGISTLEGLAAQSPWFEGLISPILDARRQQVYHALFTAGQQPQRLLADRALALSELLSELHNRQEQILFVGDGTFVHKNDITAKLGRKAVFLPPELSVCRAATIARLGLMELAAGRSNTWQDLLPHYVRNSGAQAKQQAEICKGGMS